ncbi:hypothetical protein [Calothrix sp. NIES-3974]|uniref:hypothetical protein n=1 Tax=Calothrix sp. NIES-3974 TaxID=2005462 RepID=UPI000B61E737|nr:hypothetical protein [Calothrix sp. NIES-3974]BAZ03906.1 hypothetical protein NIES3974_05360 [Calothrix sp. NIES-3974]
MTRSKIIAILTGAISILLALAYLIIVFFLDARGEMKPAPISYFDNYQPQIATVNLHFDDSKSLE